MGKKNRKKRFKKEVLENRLQIDTDNFFKKAVNSTYNELMRTTNVASTKKELLLMQSIQGKAIRGWWGNEFLKKQKISSFYYPNTTLEDIFIALDKNPLEIQKQRQEIIDDIKTYFNFAFGYLESRSKGNSKSNHCSTLLNRNYEPLGGISFFYGTLIDNPLNVLIGAYFGGCMDSAEWREKTDKKFGTKMHKGITRAVHVEKLKQEGKTVEDLSKLNSPEIINELIKKGIVSEVDNETYIDGYSCAYIQTQQGYGISDDAAFLGVASKYGIEAAQGLLLIDAVDTWDKSTPRICKGGQDEKIGVGIKEKYNHIFGDGAFPVSDDDVMNIIYLGIKDKKNYKYYISSSQRRWVEIKESNRLNTLQSHILFSRHLEKGTPSPEKMKLAFEQVPSDKFYEDFERKNMELSKLNYQNMNK